MMNKLRILPLSVLALISLLLTARAEELPFAGGDGMEESPYRIATAEQLALVSDYPEAHFLLTEDIDLSDWAGEGCYIPAAFKGVFDGGDHTVSGYTGDSALFASVNYGATVKNLHAEDFTVTSTSATGGLFGSNGGSIYDCSFSGSVTVTSGYAGGLCGRSEGRIERCTSAGTVSTGGYDRMLACAGGIAGMSYTVMIIDCHNEADVSSYYAAGGMIGYFQDGTVRGCSNAGKISVTHGFTAYIYAGGIAGDCGLNRVTIENCTNVGIVTAETTYENGAAYAAGIVAQISNAGTISGCVNSGSIDSSDCSGGIAATLGRPESTVSDCRNEGSIATTLQQNKAQTPLAGGILGSGCPSILRCCNLGTVSALFVYTTDHGSSQWYTGGNAGGILGHGSGGTVTDSFNVGDVAGRYCGGLMGRGYATLTRCYSAALSYNDVLQTTQYPRPSGRFSPGALVGERLGATYYPIKNCYWLNKTYYSVYTGKAEGTECTAAEMMRQETFAGFDFEDTWTMDGNELYPYPQLKSQTIPAEKLFSLRAYFAAGRVFCVLRSLVPLEAKLMGGRYDGAERFLGADVADAAPDREEQELTEYYSIYLEEVKGQEYRVFLVMPDWRPIIAPVIFVN